MSEATVIYSLDMALRWGDLDAYGHVNNTVFLRLLEECRVRWLATVTPDWASGAVGPVLRRAEIEFDRPIHWPATVRIQLYVERLGHSSLTIAHRIVDATRVDHCYATARAVLVWIERSTGAPTALPPALRAACVDAAA